MALGEAERKRRKQIHELAVRRISRLIREKNPNKFGTVGARDPKGHYVKGGKDLALKEARKQLAQRKKK